jgi:FKBP-type peptidyl-prolyl cis-trans isomerase SlyD
MICVSENMVITIRYIMKNSNNEVLENNMQGTPVQFLHGTNNISIILQSQLNGLQIGDKKTVYLQKEHSAADDDYTFEVLIEHVRPALKEEVMLGYHFPANADDCDADCSCHNNSNAIT